MPENRATPKINISHSRSRAQHFHESSSSQGGNTTESGSSNASSESESTEDGESQVEGSRAEGQRAEGEAKQGEGLTKEEKELAERLSSLIEKANNQLIPICKMIRRHIEAMDARKDDEKDEDELVEQVKPLLQQAEKILHETNGAVKGADPDQKLSNKARRNVGDHKAEPEEQRLAEALKVLVEEMGGTIDWAKDKLNAFPKAKRDLGPLLDALGQPLTQIIGAVGLLLAGVLNLLSNLLKGLGLDCLLKNLVGAVGLDKIYKSLGVGSWLNM